MTNEMKRLHEAVIKVKRILDDPHEGVSTWNSFLREGCVELQSALCSLGVTPETCGIADKISSSEGKR